MRNIEWFYISDLPTHKKDTVSRENLGLNPNAFFMVMPFGSTKVDIGGSTKRNQPHPCGAKNTVESPGNAQLQKLLAKEEQRLEQEQKRAAIERRRKQQQERFQQQHELNHPLRHHHTQQKTRTLKGTCRSPWRLGDIILVVTQA
ncbi:mRNA-decapping enzyme subunit 2 [Desmophyllum pertusum]|uniref:mRNA-decapping enzyme subunit 2 n=1 Tax=Desmophyllum pertusum TaxID=174260 RepID=A0A9W9YTF5_9CNID|nr:mRNA-decapping enzyme subunit 2 [Desmophyllum pertusum]